jgi:hypothetical protein
VKCHLTGPATSYPIEIEFLKAVDSKLIVSQKWRCDSHDGRNPLIEKFLAKIS